jgi:hypothetical protein
VYSLEYSKVPKAAMKGITDTTMVTTVIIVSKDFVVTMLSKVTVITM